LATAEEMFAAGYSSAAVDPIVKVDDGPAIAAIARLDHLVHDQRTASARAVNNTVGNSIGRSLILDGAMTFVILVMVVALTWFTIWRVIKPVGRIQRAMNCLAEGQMDINLADSNRHDEIGEMTRAVSVFKDNVLERRRAEEELRTSQQRFKEIAEVGSDWIWECDENLRLTYLSESFSRITGVCADRIRCQRMIDVFANNDRDWESHVADLWARRPFRDVRYTIDDEQGETRHLASSGTPVFGESGAFQGYRGTGSDRTASETMNRQLTQQAATVDLLNAISMAANQSKDTRTALDHCLALVCGYTNWEVGHVYLQAGDGSEELRPSRSWYVTNHDQYSEFKEATARTNYRAGVGLPGRVLAQGKPRWISDIRLESGLPRAKVALEAGLIGAAGYAVKVRDETIAVLEFFSTDRIDPDPELAGVLNHACTQMGRVMERERAELALKANRDRLQYMVDAATADLKERAEELKSALEKEKELNVIQRQFVAMASHEFRTPLAIIDSASQRLKSRADQNRLTSKDVRNRIEKIRSAVQRMTRLMESTLSAARMQEGKVEITLASCDIGNIVEEVCARHRDIALNHRITCRLVDLPGSIVADGGSLEQVLTNLLSNAVKYAPDAPEIEVIARREGEHVAVSVRDHGLGIDREDLKKIGQRFFRARTSTGIEGTGIGLSLVRMLIEMHDGTIAVESEKGEGSTFTIRLPIAGPTSANKAETVAA
jgi:PAS domain S-box-containing protein